MRCCNSRFARLWHFLREFKDHLELRILEEGFGLRGLGQSATTLSGGEAQRLKLPRISPRSKRGYLVYLDEPRRAPLRRHTEAPHRVPQVDRRRERRSRHRTQPRHFNPRLDHRPRPEGGEQGGRIVPREAEQVARNRAFAHGENFCARAQRSSPNDNHGPQKQGRAPASHSDESHITFQSAMVSTALLLAALG